MKKVLIVHYSQTGQLSSLARNFAAPLQTAGVQVDCVNIVPEQAFPFPWPFWRFFDTFPETVHLKPAPILPPQIPIRRLRCSGHCLHRLVPLSFATDYRLFATRRNAPPVRRQTGHHAYRLPQYVAGRAGKNEIFAETKRRQTHRQHRKNRSCNSAASFITTPAWMLTGDKRYFRSLPSAGIAEEELADAARFGTKLRDTLLNQQPLDETLFQNMGAAKVNEKLIFSERTAGRSFFVWGKLLMAAGRISPLLRRALLCFYIVFLLAMILVVLPISVILKKLLHPLLKGRLKKLADYYEQPSGR